MNNLYNAINDDIRMDNLENNDNNNENNIKILTMILII